MVTPSLSSLPAQLGVCLATDQRLAISTASSTPSGSASPSEPPHDQEIIRFPTVLCVENLRHVAPYFLHKELAIGKLATPGCTLGKALGMGIPKTTSVVKNPSLRDWWPKELQAGRLLLTNQNQRKQNLQEQTPPKPPYKVATVDHVIREGDVVTGRYHFHEQSVVDCPRPTIVYRDDHYIVVNKPGGMDVLSNPDAHRVLNSLPGTVLVLGLASSVEEDDPTTTKHAAAAVILPAHRIDNPVSGLVCCGRTNKDAKRLARKIQSRDTIKTYVARVAITDDGRKALQEGSLPLEIDVPLGFDATQGCAVVVEDATTTATKTSAKPSKTSILAILVPQQEDGTCVIAVRPHTGRKHQLRKHLAHVGLPIANDEKYNSCAPAPKRHSAFGLPTPPSELIQLFEDNYVEDCDHCQYVRRLLGTKCHPDTTLDASGEIPGPCVSQPIWLHSWRYQFPSLGLSFEAPPPEWALFEQWKDLPSWALD